MSRNSPVFLGKMVVSIVNVINSVFGGLSCLNCPITGVQLQPTVRLQIYGKFEKYKAPYASIAFEEIVIVMIS